MHSCTEDRDISVRQARDISVRQARIPVKDIFPLKCIWPIPAYMCYTFNNYLTKAMKIILCVCVKWGP